MMIQIRNVPTEVAIEICRSNNGPGWNEEMEKYLGQSLEMQLAVEYEKMKWYRYRDPITTMTWLWPIAMLEIDLSNDEYVKSLENL